MESWHPRADHRPLALPARAKKTKEGPERRARVPPCTASLPEDLAFATGRNRGTVGKIIGRRRNTLVKKTKEEPERRSSRPSLYNQSDRTFGVRDECNYLSRRKKAANCGRFPPSIRTGSSLAVAWISEPGYGFCGLPQTAYSPPRFLFPVAKAERKFSRRRSM